MIHWLSHQAGGCLACVNGCMCGAGPWSSAAPAARFSSLYSVVFFRCPPTLPRRLLRRAAGNAGAAATPRFGTCSTPRISALWFPAAEEWW